MTGILLPLRIVLESPPPGIDFALQKGKGSGYEPIQKQRSGDGNLSFEFQVRPGKEGNPDPDFSGPFVHGPSQGRFIYVDIGTYAGQSGTIWSRRLKVPLTGITWPMIRAAAPGSNKILEARVPATGRDGGPSCGTIKPFKGWSVAD